MNLCPEAIKYFSEKHPEIELYQDPEGNVWEKSLDMWHPDAFKGCGPAVESVACSPAKVEAAGPRQQVWLQLDWWANPIGQSNQDPPGYPTLLTDSEKEKD